MMRSQKLFQLILLAYPREFRREFGPDMAQVFRDCYRAEEEAGGPLGVWRLWLHTLLDLIRTAPKEHLEKLGKDSSVMNNLRKDAVALLGCIGIIVIAFLLLAYGRKHEVTPILLFGRSLDALVTAGVVGNLIVFLIVKATRLNPLRTALWAFLVVNGALFFVATLIGSRVDPQFRLGSVLLGYVVSFLFWFGLHWVWAKSKGSGQLAVSSGSNH
jgi:hypothetical protein